MARHKHIRSRNPHQMNDFFMALTGFIVVIVLCFVGSISMTGGTTGKNLVLPQFETNKGAPLTQWREEKSSDKQFWNAAFSMAGAPIPQLRGQTAREAEERKAAFGRLLMKMRHYIEMQGLTSTSEQKETLQYLKAQSLRGY